MCLSHTKQQLWAAVPQGHHQRRVLLERIAVLARKTEIANLPQCG